MLNSSEPKKAIFNDLLSLILETYEVENGLLSDDELEILGILNILISERYVNVRLMKQNQCHWLMSIDYITRISFNNDCLPRLIKFYTPVDLDTQIELMRQVYQLVHNRQASQSSFLTLPPLLEDQDDIKVIYRHYATLYFVFIVDEQESELGILDLIQVFVQCLDKCFENVCELDLVFGWQVLQSVLEEIVQGGMVIETNIASIVSAVDAANQEKNGSNGSGAFGLSSSAFASASSAFSAFTRDGRLGWTGR
ncbi:hypothetical protein WICPIJ_005973 [Wickerhamomyces pijperi]|uniref:AP-3 complex subunit sigma n=1 Tax=Wickerhamomyces pijperi TaxID=599730 RepID=A0A9P8Q564_WICPI|nr:hypothetical protein WICPIJ_005973 [Wickerhamomyces pijperi]